MSIDKMIQTLTEMKEKWGDIDVRVKEAYSFGTIVYAEPWLTVTKIPTDTSTNYIVIR